MNSFIKLSFIAALQMGTGTLLSCERPGASTPPPSDRVSRELRSAIGHGPETIGADRESPLGKANLGPRPHGYQTILHSGSLQRGVRFENHPGVVEIRDRELDPVTLEWEEGIWRYSTSLVVRGISQRDADEIFVYGTLLGMDVFERWGLENQEGGHYYDIDFESRPIGVPDPVYGAPSGSTGITGNGGVYIPIGLRPPNRSVTREAVFMAPADPGAPRGWFWVDPEGRFLHWIRYGKLWRLDLPTTPGSAEVEDFDLSSLMGENILFGVGKYQHVSNGRYYAIVLSPSWEWLLIQDADNDGITDHAEVLTETEYEASYNGSWIDDFIDFE